MIITHIITINKASFAVVLLKDNDCNGTVLDAITKDRLSSFSSIAEVIKPSCTSEEKKSYNHSFSFLLTIRNYIEILLPVTLTTTATSLSCIININGIIIITSSGSIALIDIFTPGCRWRIWQRQRQRQYEPKFKSERNL